MQKCASMFITCHIIKKVKAELKFVGKLRLQLCQNHVCMPVNSFKGKWKKLFVSISSL